MSLYLFSTLILSIVFLLVFNSWWSPSAPFATHLTGMLIAGSVLITLMLLLIMSPVLKRQGLNRMQARLHHPHWEREVSSRLTSPAAW
ncbi:hypothetical protein [Methylobacillus glycogenes]|uniref:hypothetical protein n=1 Tax=Methylobacillus glycogenes TaxID=406 RepID=UPI001F3227EB|nr:hypothetical protein [Methylobacillus glycogenes]